MLDAYKSKLIEDRMKFDYNIVDFFYAYCEAKGIDNPEEDITDEEYDALENEFCEKINDSILYRFKISILADIQEEIKVTMEQLIKERR